LTKNDKQIAHVNQYLVTRSPARQVSHYREYKQQLRYDFIYSCAYCSITEAEAGGISFAIDHCRPKRSHPTLEKDYDNLMYCCEPCNSRKGDQDPPEKAQKEGLRFFRPDRDARPEHFSLKNMEVAGKTAVGNYSIEALDLNRLTLRRLRGIRARFADTDEYIAEGVLSLYSLRIDQLRPDARVRALRARDKLINMVKDVRDDFDDLLRATARSGLVDPDPEAEARFQDRAAKLREYQSLYAGRWRARDT
jgi:5-methylcytosine-specific restriction endonuclease McrA